MDPFRIGCPGVGNMNRRSNTVKNLAVTALAAALTLSVPAFADDTHHPQAETAPKAGSAAATMAQSPTLNVQKMRDNLDKMKTQLDRIAKAKTDPDRQIAMMDHMTTMQENMQMAQGMMGGMNACPMGGHAMMGSGAMMSGRAMMGGAMMGGQAGGMGMMCGQGADRMQQMERRMDMMQMMMEQMNRRPEAATPQMPMKQ